MARIKRIFLTNTNCTNKTDFFYEHEFSMKAMTRTKLAECAGVSRKTLGKYIEGHLAELQPLGLRPRDILPPSVVEWLSRNYGIDVDD